MSYDAPEEQLRPRLIGSALLAAPVVLVSMVSALQRPGWRWLVLALTTPIVFWGGSPFHKAALNSARHGSSTMDTLVSLGTLAAYLWSAVAVFTGTGHVSLRGGRSGHGLPAGRALCRGQAKRSAGSALRALLSLGARTRPCCATARRSGSRPGSCRWAT